MPKINIIGGKWRSISIEFIDKDSLRPTANRIRETLFNWLGFDIVNSSVLDLFAGSGALAFEALSRGAKTATLVELDNNICQQLQKQKQILNIDNIDIINQNAINYIATIKNRRFDYIFLDPPFSKYNIVEIIIKLLANNIATQGVKIYLEDNNDNIFNNLITNTKLLKHKKAGNVHYGLIEVL